MLNKFSFIYQLDIEVYLCDTRSKFHLSFEQGTI